MSTAFLLYYLRDRHSYNIFHDIYFFFSALDQILYHTLHKIQKNKPVLYSEQTLGIEIALFQHEDQKNYALSFKTPLKKNSSMFSRKRTLS